MKEKVEKIIAYTLGGGLITCLVSLFTTVMIGGYGILKIIGESGKKIEETSNLVFKAQELSKGKDGIWSIDEKNEFIKTNGLNYSFKENTVFVINPGKIDIYEKLPNDFFGSREKFIGSIQTKKLENYIKTKEYERTSIPKFKGKNKYFKR